MIGKLAFRGLMVCWALAVCAGILFLTHYSNKPGKAASAPEMWPANSALKLAQDKPSLLVLLHPQCSCSRATLRELERMMARVSNQVDTRLLFYESSTMDSAWVKGDLWDIGRAIPDVRLVRDVDGQLTKAFGAYTSGQTLLYDTSGALLFRGGITPARGHEGDNAGKQALLSILKERNILDNESPVFGCSILGDTRT